MDKVSDLKFAYKEVNGKQVKMHYHWDSFTGIYLSNINWILSRKFDKENNINDDDDDFIGPDLKPVYLSYREHKDAIKRANEWTKLLGIYHKSLKINRLRLC